MPATYTYPGVYVEEVPSGVHPIAGVSTSDTAFVDYFRRGPIGVPVRVSSFTEFEREFGGLDAAADASYQVQQFFVNGGAVAWIVREALNAKTAAGALNKASKSVFDASAANAGSWGTGIQVAVDQATTPTGGFNLYVREVQTIRGVATVVSTEVHRNLTVAATDARYAINVVNADSRLLRLAVPTSNAAAAGAIPDASTGDPVADIGKAVSTAYTALTVGTDPDGTRPGQTELIAGVDALDQIAPAVFNLLVLPADLPGADDAARAAAFKATIGAAQGRAEAKRAFLIYDVPASRTLPADARTWFGGSDRPDPSKNSAAYWPALQIADPLNEGRPRVIGARGAVAGVYARTDAARGVWKAPAGTDASLRGSSVTTTVNDSDDGSLNILGLNVLRSFPIYGNVVWGARTTKGSDTAADEWKYVPVRRTALYIEESLYQGLKWVVFEPNDEPLWAQIRLNVGSFMHGLFRQGAFAGPTPREAYFVKCDKDTTTQGDVDRGIVNILVGFKPLKPAEFVVLRIQQMAGQIET
jgi:phage tail sheath protein FI